MHNFRNQVFSALLFLAMVSCNQKTASQTETSQTNSDTANTQTTSQQPCIPLETRSPNASDQKPTFNGQTRACGIKSEVAFHVEVLAKGLKNPWAVEPLPNGDLLVTEKPGRLRVISATGKVGDPLAGVPEVEDSGQGGLLDVVLSPNFATDRTIFWSFSEPRQGGNATSVARALLSADHTRLEQVKVIFRAMPTYDGSNHFGSRLTFGPDGFIYMTLGDRSDLETRPQAQQMNSHNGKILRLTTNGAPAPGNPFLDKEDALPEIWSLGHRNVQSAAFDLDGSYWVVEMGPKGGDELNLVEKGKNYGWPLVTFGEEYSGMAVANAVTTRAGFVDPVYYWDPVIAPSGAQFYSGKAFPEWKGSLFVGGLRSERLIRLKIENNRVAGEEHLLTDRKQRIRDVREGADGALYLVTDEADGELWKIVPKK